MKLCEFPEDINTCPHFIKEGLRCSREQKCSYQKETEEPETIKYVRKERWYEKYYRKH